MKCGLNVSCSAITVFTLRGAIKVSEPFASLAKTDANTSQVWVYPTEPQCFLHTSHSCCSGFHWIAVNLGLTRLHIQNAPLYISFCNLTHVSATVGVSIPHCFRCRPLSVSYSSLLNSSFH